MWGHREWNGRREVEEGKCALVYMCAPTFTRPASVDSPLLSSGDTHHGHPCQWICHTWAWGRTHIQWLAHGANSCFWRDHTPHCSLLLSLNLCLALSSQWSCLHAASHSCSDLSKSSRLPSGHGCRAPVAAWKTSVVLLPGRGVWFYLGIVVKQFRGHRGKQSLPQWSKWW